MNLTFRLAWRNIWRQPRRTGLTLAAIAFAATVLIFMITIQQGSYQMLINNNLRLLTGHFQIQQTGYLEKPKIRNAFNHAQQLVEQLRSLNHVQHITPRSYGFSLLASAKRTYGVQIIGVDTPI
ncbi:MAG: hypothetical protein KAH84_06950 [Thiomargarita sp.]|nr:hypothetical protein [Bacteroidales bacterium]MCK5719674.1 hypothetical protein [Thiomargarita sp.]